MHPRAQIAAALVAGATLALSACGGEPRRSPVAEQALTTPAVSQPSGTARVSDPRRARYVKQVDAVCARLNPQREAALKLTGDAADQAEALREFDRSIALASDQLRGIAAITPPAADRQLIASNVVARLQERLTLRRRLRVDLADDNITDAQRNRAQLDALTIALQAFARGYGFRVCGAR